MCAAEAVQTGGPSARAGETVSDSRWLERGGPLPAQQEYGWVGVQEPERLTWNDMFLAVSASFAVLTKSTGVALSSTGLTSRQSMRAGCLGCGTH